MARTQVIKNCLNCGTEFSRRIDSVGKTCGHRCRAIVENRRRHVPVEVAFWSKVARRGPDECWIWLASVDQGGYGHFWFMGKSDKAHRVAWILTNGPIPDAQHALHNCDVRYPAGDITNRRCVNPNHLWLGTNSENTADRVKKLRQGNAKGVDNPAAKLTEALVLDIRASKDSAHSWAKRLNVAPSLIWSVRTRRSWKHIS